MKQIIREEKTKTVNDIQLNDLYEASAKTEQQIINLCVASMSFSNAQIKKTAVALKSQASELTQLIGAAMQEEEGIGMDNLSVGGEEEGGMQDLEANPNAEQMIGEVVNGLKKIVEAFDFKRDVLDKNKEEKDGAKAEGKKDKEKEEKDEINEDDTTASEGTTAPMAESIDMKESYKFMSEGTLKSTKFLPFKTSVLKTLAESKVSKNIVDIIDKVNKSENISEINECFNSLYDFADANNIEIITE